MTTYITKAKDIQHNWNLIDLNDQILGRAATQIACLLQGKHKVYYVANLDCGDNVVAINAAKIKVTGKKIKNKMYYHHSNYPGGFKTISYQQQMAKNPAKIIMLAVKNMLPKNKLRAERLRRLKVFTGSEHIYGDKFKKVEVGSKDIKHG